MFRIAFVISCFAFAYGGSEDQIQIIEHASACLSERTLPLQCPEGHVAIVKYARYLKSLEPGCNPASDDVCEQEDVRAQWFTRCYFSQQQRCEINLGLSRQASICRGYQGSTFLRVRYRCEIYIGDALETNARDMCAMDTAWEGSLLYLHSPAWPAWSRARADCGCSVTVHTSVQLEVNLPDFESDDKDSEDCSQLFQIQSGTASQTICSEHHVKDYKPLDMEYESNVFFKIENTEGEGFRFLLVLQVHHAEKVKVECSSNYIMPKEVNGSAHSAGQNTPVTTLSAEDGATREVLTPQAREQKDSDEIPWSIITGAVGAVCLLIVVVVAVLLFCRKSSTKSSDSTKDLVFENNTYVATKQESAPRTQTIINMGNINTEEKQVPTNVIEAPPCLSHNQDVKRKPQQVEQKKKGKERLSVQMETQNPSLHDQQANIACKDAPTPKKLPAYWQKDNKAQEELKAMYPNIPEGVLKDIRGQSEATIAFAEDNIKTEGFNGVGDSDNKTLSVKERAELLSTTESFKRSPSSDIAISKDSESEETPYSSMTDLSVKVRAQLITQQLRPAMK